MNGSTWEILWDPLDELEGGDPEQHLERPWVIRGRVFSQWYYLDARFSDYAAARATLLVLTAGSKAEERERLEQIVRTMVTELDESAKRLKNRGETQMALVRRNTAGVFMDLVQDMFTTQRLEHMELLQNMGKAALARQERKTDDAYVPGPAWLEDMMDTETCPECEALLRDCECGDLVDPPTLIKDIVFAGQRARIACDNHCHKAWGTQLRPRIQLSDDPDDYAMLADDELGTAPVDPGTEEGPHRKPRADDEKMNKWCARQCERCEMVLPNETIVIRSFRERRYNIPRKDTNP